MLGLHQKRTFKIYSISRGILLDDGLTRPRSEQNVTDCLDVEGVHNVERR